MTKNDLKRLYKELQEWSVPVTVWHDETGRADALALREQLYTAEVAVAKMIEEEPDTRSTLKGTCGICGVNIYAEDERYKRTPDEPYVCADCHEVYFHNSKCGSCSHLFNCDLDHNDSDCAND